MISKATCNFYIYFPLCWVSSPIAFSWEPLISRKGVLDLSHQQNIKFGDVRSCYIGLSSTTSISHLWNGAPDQSKPNHLSPPSLKPISKGTFFTVDPSENFAFQIWIIFIYLIVKAVPSTAGKYLNWAPRQGRDREDDDRD